MFILYLSVAYIYGLKRLLRDIKFMLDQKLGIYWKVCWGVIVPGALSFIFVYFAVTFEEITYAGTLYPSSAILAGWVLVMVAWLPVPMGAIYWLYNSEKETFISKIIDICTPTKLWGPMEPKEKEEWLLYTEDSNHSSDDEYPLINDTGKD